MGTDVTKKLTSGRLARLIPTVADSKKEERATSSLLASFMVVPAFAREVLSEAGATIGKKATIQCYTEVVFKSLNNNKKPRPDGLIVISSGSKRWTALVESKIGTSELNREQIEEYLDLAKEYEINALITISNQFATTPTHHPVLVSKTKLRSVELYHFSWLALMSKCVLITDNKEVNDPEQAYILSELVRYLRHDFSGVSSLTKMHRSWKDACLEIHQGGVLKKNSEVVENTVSDWHQLLRHLSLNLSMRIGELVKLSLSRARTKNAELNFQEDCTKLIKENCLSAEFDIPNAASRLYFSADFMRRTINISMTLEAPKDKSRATASFTWLTRQLRGLNLNNITIRAHWPKRMPMTTASLDAVSENPKILLPDGSNTLPTYLEVVRIVDTAGRFRSPKSFVEDASKEFLSFYDQVGQHLSKWIAKAPQVKEVATSTSSVPTIFSGSNEEVISTKEPIEPLEPMEQVQDDKCEGSEAAYTEMTKTPSSQPSTFGEKE